MPTHVSAGPTLLLSDGPTLLTQLRAIVIEFTGSISVRIINPVVRIVISTKSVKNANSAVIRDCGTLWPFIFTGRTALG